MASFTGVGDSVSLTLPDKDEAVAIAISGTYNMTILFQRQVGSSGSGAWETINTYTTANATVADTYYTQTYNETVRLIVTVDTSGTATATLTDNSVLTIDYREIKDRVGNSLLSFDQAGATFSGDVSVAGDLTKSGSSYGPAAVAVTAATLTVTAASHAGRVVTLDPASGVAVTLPAATGTGNVYKFVVVGALGASSTIKCASASDSMLGMSVAIDATNFLATAGDDTITMNATTTGGLPGTIVTITDVATGLFIVEMWQGSSGAEATPFSATVS